MSNSCLRFVPTHSGIFPRFLTTQYGPKQFNYYDFLKLFWVLIFGELLCSISHRILLRFRPKQDDFLQWKWQFLWRFHFPSGLKHQHWVIFKFYCLLSLQFILHFIFRLCQSCHSCHYRWETADHLLMQNLHKKVKDNCSFWTKL